MQTKSFLTALFFKTKVALDRNSARLGIRPVFAVVTAIAVLVICLSAVYTRASAGTYSSTRLCGDGSAPDYGFTYDRMQEHWTVGWQRYVSGKTVNEVDEILDRLNEDSIAQTMILIKPADQVGNPVNCAVHFLRYMQLGLPSGERKDNGFVFLIVVESNSIDVHYGVGLGLPALTARELTDLNRAAEQTYQSTHSLDQALLSLVQGFDTVARSKYAPLITPTPTPEAVTGPQGGMSAGSLLCLGIILLLFLVWWLPQLTRTGGFFIPPSSGDWGGRSDGWGRGSSSGWNGGGSSTRGGSGSGRSGRGN